MSELLDRVAEEVRKRAPVAILDLRDNIQEAINVCLEENKDAEDAYNIYHHGTHGQHGHTPWKVVMGLNGYEDTRTRWLNIGAYIAAMVQGGAK